MNKKKTLTKGLTAMLAAATLAGGFAMATDASAQSRRYYRGYDNWSTADSLALGLGIGAGVAGGYGRGYYGRGYYGPRYYGGRGYYAPRAYGYYAPRYARTCRQRVWDPYLGRWVRVRTWC